MGIEQRYRFEAIESWHLAIDEQVRVDFLVLLEFANAVCAGIEHGERHCDVLAKEIERCCDLRLQGERTELIVVDNHDIHFGVDESSRTVFLQRVLGDDTRELIRHAVLVRGRAATRSPRR